MKPTKTAEQQNGQQQNSDFKDMPTVRQPLFSDQEKNLFATIADAALKAAGWNVLEAVNYWKNKIDKL